jgi:hypothetical protein
MFGIYTDAPECLIAPGMSLNYMVWPTSCEGFLCIDGSRTLDHLGIQEGLSENVAAMFERLVDQKDAIERLFGSELDWRGNFIGFRLAGGYLCPEEEWDEILSRQVGAMVRLHNALLPQIQPL